VSDGHEPDPSRLVADAGVLAADLLVGGASRDVLDTVRAHSWLELVATEQLLDDTETVVGALADPDLAADWRSVIADLVVLVEQPAGDHPALAAAHRGDAAHVVSLDDRLTSVEAGANLKGTLEASVRSPDAFRAIVDPATLHELAFDEPYFGPDRNPRA
jgi:hypothetical protein